MLVLPPVKNKHQYQLYMSEHNINSIKNTSLKVLSGSAMVSVLLRMLQMRYPRFS